MLNLWTRFQHSSTTVKLITLGVLVTWALALLIVATGLIIYRERPSIAQSSVGQVNTPMIDLEPALGPINSLVTVQGQGWKPGETVLIYLTAPDESNRPDYAVSSVVADNGGQFITSVIIPTDARWEAPGIVRVVAQLKESLAGAQAPFEIINLAEEPTTEPTEELTMEATEPMSPTLEPEATATATQTPTTVVPTATPQPGGAGLTVTTNLNVRSGPGTAYPVIGLLLNGQRAAITGVSPDFRWWQIKFVGVPEEHGWVAAQYTEVKNIEDVPVVQPPVLPATPTPAPVVTTDWRGEYFNNLSLNGPPVLVRNDATINFDWGLGAPGSGVSVDNFSVRWTRPMNFPGGTYRFYLQADDGVRLWVDDRLIIDQWRDSSPTTYQAEVSLTEGMHTLRLEYYERGGTAVAKMSWQLVESYPDWRGEYFNNPDLSGAPVLVRNDVALQFGWGTASPGPGVPADNFSARWTRDIYFSAGTYRFSLLVDDGARLWVDDTLVIDRWRSGEPRSYTADISLSNGTHRLRLEYFDYRYDAQVRLDWERLSSSYPDWKAEYFTNRKLKGEPFLVRNETKIDHDWDKGSPAAGIPGDDFSVRWTRKADFESGLYLVKVKVDDGVRLWFDDDLIIDSWQDGKLRTLETEREVSGGQHKIRVEYYERRGEARIEVSWQQKPRPANQLPLANAGGPYTVDEGEPVTVDGRSSFDPDGSIVSYEWDFDYRNGNFTFDPDGSIVSYEWDFDYRNGNFTVDGLGPMASTRFPDGPATLVVALRVTDDKGGSQMATTQLTVQNVAPSVEAGGPYAGLVGNLITLAGTAVDPGLIDQTGLSFRWEFGDGSVGSGPVVAQSYAQPGVYTVKLTVTDKDGAQGSDMATVQVTQAKQSPQVVLAAPGAALVGQAVEFSGSGSSDPDGNLVSYAWDFGDGASGSGMTASHSYSQAGSYQVTLTVTDNDGLSAAASQAIQIDEPINQPPQAVLIGPETGLVGQAVEFNGSGSSDPDGNLVSYAWDFGDGASGSGMTASHSYSQAGSYQVTLTVTDNDGFGAATSQTIQVSEPVNQPPQAVIAVPVSTPVGEIVAFSAAMSSDPDGSLISYAWDFGDGTIDSGVEVSHSYTVAGSYTITLTVTDNGGQSASAVHQVEVSDIAL